MSELDFLMQKITPLLLVCVAGAAAFGFFARGDHRRGGALRFFGSSVLLWSGFVALRILVGVPLAYGIYDFLGRAALFSIAPGWGSGLVCFIAVDFIYYWRHRLEHRLPLLWADHGVHHSGIGFNLTTALQLPWVAVLYDWIYSVPLALLGFRADIIVACLVLNLFLQSWSHIDGCDRLPGLDAVFATPGNHRVHHEAPGLRSRNFGAVFILWDRVFGTFAPPRRQSEVAAEPAWAGEPFLARLGGPFLRLGRGIRRARGWRGRLNVLYREAPERAEEIPT